MTLQSITPVASGGASMTPGFADLVFDAQAVFRMALLATAYPGRAIPLDRTLAPPPPLSPATAALCLTLMDFETRVWLDRQIASGEVPNWLRFHCGLPLIDETSLAHFAVVTDALNLPHLSEFRPGDVEYPDRSTTLILQVKSFTDGPATTWSGPGIKESAAVAIDGLPSWFWSDWELNSEPYPRGIDVIFTCRNTLMGMPRTIKVSIDGKVEA
ncbi:phosphonate C-P lyase system protein PhnH [Bradyrhizobium sp. Arg314]